MRRAVLLLASLLAGCVAPPNADPTLRIEATGVELLALPAATPFGSGLAVTWVVHNPTGAVFGGTGLRYGPAGSPDDANLTERSYPFALTAPQGPPGRVSAVVPANLSTLHLRAWAVLDGETWWSPEAAVEVAGAPFGDPEARVRAPTAAEAGVPFEVRWSASNATAARAELVARPPAAPDGTTPRGTVRLGAALNGSGGEFRRNLTLPFPGNWTLTARVNLSGAIVADQVAQVAVGEPAAPNLAWIEPPLSAQPGERLVLQVRFNGPGAPSGIRVGAAGQDVPAEPRGNRTFQAVVFAPAAGSMEARASSAAPPIQSAPLHVAVVTQPGPWTVALVSYTNQTLPGAQVRVLLRVSGPAANATFAGVHAGNRSVEGPPGALSPANYTAGTAFANGTDARGRWPVPATLAADLTAPNRPGVLFLRARVVIDGVAHWSTEGSVLVRSG